MKKKPKKKQSKLIPAEQTRSSESVKPNAVKLVFKAQKCDPAFAQVSAPESNLCLLH